MSDVNIGTLSGLIQLTDEFSPVLDKADMRLESSAKYAESLGNSFSSAGRSLLPFSAGLGLVGGAAIKMATDLNENLANVSALLTDLSGTELDKVVGSMREGVQKLAVDMGKSSSDISGGLYEVISSLGYTDDTFGQLEISAKAGAAGLASTQEAFKFLSAVTKTYGDTSEGAFKKVANLGFQAVNLGQTTFPELAASIGGVAPIAKTVGVSMEEMFAIIATATGVTGNTNEVITQMASAISGLITPNKEMTTALEAMGVASGKALIQENGLVGALQKLTKYAEGAGVEVAELLGRKEGYILTSALAGAQAEDFGKKLGKMGEAADKNANIVGDAFQKQTQGVNSAGFAWKQFRAEMGTVLEDLGQELIPVLHDAFKALRPLFDLLKTGLQIFSSLPQPIKTFAIALAGIAVIAAPTLLFFGSLSTGLASFITLAGKIGPAATMITTALKGVQGAKTAQAATSFGTDIIGGMSKSGNAVGGVLRNYDVVAKGMSDAATKIGASTGQINKYTGDMIKGMSAAGQAAAGQTSIWTKFFTAISGGFATIGGWITKIFPSFTGFFTTIGGWLARIIPMFTSWSGVMTILTRVFAAVRVGLAAFTGPIGWIITAVTLLVPLLYKWIGGWEGIKDIAGRVWKVLEAGWQVVKDLTTVLSWLAGEVLKGLYDSFMEIVGYVAAKVAPAFEWISELVGDAGTAIMHYGGIALEWLIMPWQKFASFLYNNLPGVKTFVDAIFGGVGGTIQGIMNKIGALVDWARDKLTWLHNAAEAIRGGQGELPALPPVPGSTLPKPFIGPQAPMGPFEGPTIKSPSSNTNMMVDELNKYKAALAGLKPEVRANIQAGLEMGMSHDAIAKKLNIAEPVVDMFAKSVSASGKAAKQAAKDFDEYTGAAAMKDASELATALGSGKLELVRMTEEQQRRVADVLAKGSAAWTAAGKVVPASVNKQIDAVTKLRIIPDMLEKGNEFARDSQKKLVDDFLKQNERLVEARMEAFKEAVFAADDITQEYKRSFMSASELAIDDAERLRDELLKSIEPLRGSALFDPALIAIWDTFNKKLYAIKDPVNFAKEKFEELRDSGKASAEEIRDAWEDWFELMFQAKFPWMDKLRHDLGNLTYAFDTLADAVGGSFGEILRDLGDFNRAMDLGLGGFKDMAKGVELYKSGDKMGGIAQTASGASSIYAGMMQATPAGGNSAANIAKGAGYGAMQGMMVGAMWGKAAGAWGMAIGAAAGAVVGFVRSRMVSKEEKEARKTYHEWEDMIADSLTWGQAAEAQGRKWAAVNISVRDSYLAVGYSEEQAMAALEKLNAATHISSEAVAEEMRKINNVREEAIRDQERLTKAVEKYGFTMEEVGAVMRQQQMHATAVDLIEDWRVLVNSGINFALVNERMADAINEYFHMALKTGAEVPAAFEPILRKMVETGDLTNLNGEAITDLNSVSITWARTMGQEFDRMIEKMEQMFERVFGVTDAINDIPRTVNVDINYNVRTPSEDALPTGWVAQPRSPSDEPGALAGYARGTQGQYLDFGAGTPVVLHGRERVSTWGEDEMEGGGLTIVNNITVNAYNEGDYERAIREHTTPVLVDAVLRHNVANSRDKLRRGLK